MKKRITLLNIISSIFLQLVTIISYFVIPKIILSYFGSNVNGLVSSLNQFLNYITLIEGGVTGVVSANLYKPLVEKNDKKISEILYTAKSFYKKIGYIYIIYSLIIAICYPLLFNNDFSWLFIFTLTIILSMKLLTQYMFSITFKTLISADKKSYIISISQSIMILFDIIMAYISIKIYPSIHLLKLFTGLLYFTQPIIYSYYVNKNYNINKNINTKDNNLLKQRWNGFAVNVAAFIHSCTDISILTIFTNLATVSIYSVYALVTTGLKQIIVSVSRAIVPTIGQSYASEDIDSLNIKMDLYEYIIFILVFFLFSVGGLLITPFVMIYTVGINDANYFQPLFGVLLIVSEALYLIKLPHLELSYSANKFKEITIPSFTEALINIVISLLLVKKYELIGIMIGTIIAMLYRMMFHIYFTTKLIDGRKQKNFYKKLMIFVLGTIIGIIISHSILPIVKYNLISWVIGAIVYSCVFGLIYIIISLLFFKKEIIYFKRYLLKNEKKRR